MRRAFFAGVALALALVWPASAHIAVPRSSIVAVAGGAPVYVYSRPGASAPSAAFGPATPLGATRVFLVRGRSRGWLNVLLPTRPNGSAGWIRAGSVRLATTDIAIVVELSAHLLTVTRDGAIAMQFQVGIGKPSTPTPTGEFFVTELVQLADPSGVYGPFAAGLSAYSDTIAFFNGLPAQIAIHGTNEPASIGHDTSNGCIHVSNADVRRLVQLVPLGAPVLIVP